VRSWTCISGESSNQKGLSEPCQGRGPYETRYHGAESSNSGSSHGELRKSGTKYPPNFNTCHERPRQCLRPTLHERTQRDAFEGDPLGCMRSGKLNATFSPRHSYLSSVDRRRSPLGNAGIHHWRAWLRMRCELDNSTDLVVRKYDVGQPPDYYKSYCRSTEASLFHGVLHCSIKASQFNRDITAGEVLLKQLLPSQSVD